MAPSLIFSLPPRLPLTLRHYSDSLIPNRTANLIQTCLYRLMALPSQLLHLALHRWKHAFIFTHVRVQTKVAHQVFLDQRKSSYLLLRDLFLVADQCQQVEADLACLIALDPFHYLLAGEGQPVVVGARAVRDRTFLEPVQLVELPVEGDVADEVEGVFFLARVLGLLKLKRVLASEAVVGRSDDFGVANGPPFVLARQAHTEVL